MNSRFQTQGKLKYSKMKQGISIQPLFPTIATNHPPSPTSRVCGGGV